MTEGEALSELGLSGTPTPEEIRAAYLRLVKQRKPDVDPDGFQRLRTAFELIRHGVAKPEAEPARPVPTSELDEARAWLRQELETLGSAPFRALQRIDAIDFVLERFPGEPALTILLISELHGADFRRQAAEAVASFFRTFGERRESEPVWRWVVANHPALLDPHHAETAPSWLGAATLLELAHRLVRDRQESMRAALLLKRVFVDASRAELEAHAKAIVATILESARRQLVLAIDLARRFRELVKTDETETLAQWAELGLPADAMLEVVNALASKRAIDVAPIVIEVLIDRLEERPALTRALGTLVPPLSSRTTTKSRPPDELELAIAQCTHVLATDPHRAVNSMQRLLEDTPSALFRKHERLVFEFIFELAKDHAGEATTLSMRLFRTTLSDQADLVAEWGSLLAHVPTKVTRQLGEALRTGTQPRLDLAAPERERLVLELKTRTPRLASHFANALKTPRERIRVGVEWVLIIVLLVLMIAMIVARSQPR